MDGLRVGDPQTFFLNDCISQNRTTPDPPEKEHTPSDPFQRAMVPYSSRSLFSMTVASSDLHHHACPVRDVVREWQGVIGDAEIPYIQDGFFGPGISLIEEVRCRLYQM